MRAVVLAFTLALVGESDFSFYKRMILVSICIRHYKLHYILCYFKIISTKWMFLKENLKLNVVYHLIYLNSILCIVKHC